MPTKNPLRELCEFLFGNRKEVILRPENQSDHMVAGALLAFLDQRQQALKRGKAAR